MQYSWILGVCSRIPIKNSLLESIWHFPCITRLIPNRPTYLLENIVRWLSDIFRCLIAFFVYHNNNNNSNNRRVRKTKRIFKFRALGESERQNFFFTSSVCVPLRVDGIYSCCRRSNGTDEKKKSRPFDFLILFIFTRVVLESKLISETVPKTEFPPCRSYVINLLCSTVKRHRFPASPLLNFSTEWLQNVILLYEIGREIPFYRRGFEIGSAG